MELKVKHIQFSKEEIGYLTAMLKSLYKQEGHDTESKALWASLAVKISGPSSYSEVEQDFLKRVVDALIDQIDAVLNVAKEEQIEVRVKAQALKSIFNKVAERLISEKENNGIRK